MRRSNLFDEEAMEFNFWPSFTDLMLSVVLIMIVILFLYISYLSIESVSLSTVKQNQSEVLSAIASAYKTDAQTISSTPNITKYSIANDILVQNEPALQRISFQENVLFVSGDSKLRFEGKKVLDVVGGVLSDKLASIREIQIQGHADTDGDSKNNLRLASERAMNVYRYLQDQVGIDPAKHLMSATTFGEYKPVNRDEENLKYSQKLLESDNSNISKKRKNRRIELLIFYTVALRN